MHHRREDRIRANVQLCWLALLLVRIAETGDPTRTWRRLREELQTLQVGTSPATPDTSASAPS